MRIIVADGDPRTFSALRILFGCEPGLEIVGETTSASRLVELAGDLEPDVVLLDWKLKGRLDGTLLSDLRNTLPQAHIIAMSGRPESEREAIYAGADAFVSKAEPASALIAQVKSLVAGDQIGELARGPADDRLSVFATRRQDKLTSEGWDEKAVGSSEHRIGAGPDGTSIRTVRCARARRARFARRPRS